MVRYSQTRQRTGAQGFCPSSPEREILPLDQTAVLLKPASQPVVARPSRQQRCDENTKPASVLRRLGSSQSGAASALFRLEPTGIAFSCVQTDGDQCNYFGDIDPIDLNWQCLLHYWISFFFLEDRCGLCPLIQQRRPEKNSPIWIHLSILLRSIIYRITRKWFFSMARVLEPAGRSRR